MLRPDGFKQLNRLQITYLTQNLADLNKITPLVQKENFKQHSLRPEKQK